MRDKDILGKAKRLLIYIPFAILFIWIGILIASNFNWSSHSEAVHEVQSSFKDPLVEHPSGLRVSEQKLLADQENPFVAVAEKVSPAVINISAEKTVERRGFHDYFPFEDFFRRFFGEVPERRLPQTQKTKSLGSGFIFRKDGYVLTNNHVVAGADNILVKLPDGSQYMAKVVGLDKDTDIAVLKIEAGTDLPTIEFGDSDSLRVGEWVMAIGNPFPQLGLDRTVTVGVVSAKGRSNLRFGPEETPNYQNYIQTDASINPGNSGGPLVNIKGKVIGINSAITNPTGMSFNIGIGFAIPINLAKWVIPDLVEKGRVSRGFLGIIFQKIDNNTADALDLPSAEGVLVRSVQPDTPADQAGVEIGDVITKFNGHKVRDGEKFRMMVAEAGPGQEVTLDIVRAGKKLTKKLTLADREKFISGTEKGLPAKEKTENWLGLEVATCTKALAAQFNVKFQPGVIVLGVERGSPAEQSKFIEGDIITKISNEEIENIDDYKKAAKSLTDREKPLLFFVSRDGEPLFIAVKP
ncbi:MAG: DegQ family serine endoprotease [candidate division Zixibacteria bacterium]|nr:DegQ family serine endoprotease [candidate division Zixibacteria bacterium]